MDSDNKSSEQAYFLEIGFLQTACIDSVIGSQKRLKLRSIEFFRIGWRLCLSQADMEQKTRRNSSNGKIFHTND